MIGQRQVKSVPPRGIGGLRLFSFVLLRAKHHTQGRGLLPKHRCPCQSGTTPVTETYIQERKRHTGKMFSGFDNLAEGFKRFSLDALQDQLEDVTPAPEQPSIIPSIPEQQTEIAKTPSPKKLPPPAEEPSEWDWDEQNTRTAAVGRKGKLEVGASQQQHETHLERPPETSSTTSERTAVSTASLCRTAEPSLAATCAPVELDQYAPHESTGSTRVGGAFGEPEGPEHEITDKSEVPEERGDRQVFQEGNPEGLAADSSPLTPAQVAEGLCIKTVRDGCYHCCCCGRCKLQNGCFSAAHRLLVTSCLRR